MAEPVRELALAALAELLKTQLVGTRPWGGVYPNPVVVSRKWEDMDKVTQFPKVIVLEGPGTTMSGEEDEDVRSTGSHNVLVHKLSVEVTGYVRGDAVVSRSTWLQRLWDDVARTLIKNQRLGETVRTIEFGDEYENDNGQFEPVGGFRQLFIVTLDDQWEIQ